MPDLNAHIPNLTVTPREQQLIASLTTPSMSSATLTLCHTTRGAAIQLCVAFEAWCETAPLTVWKLH